MDVMTLVTYDAAMRVEVGFDRRYGGYWAAIYEGDQLISGSEPGELLTLGDLVGFCHGVVDFEASREVLVVLRDPWAHEAPKSRRDDEIQSLLRNLVA